MDKFYICTKSCTSLPVQYIAGKIYRMDESGCIYGEDHCGRYPECTDSEFREATQEEIDTPPYDLEVEMEKFFHKLELRGGTPGVPDEYIDEATFEKIARHFVQWQRRRFGKDHHYVSDHAIKMIQKSWYLEGWHDKEFNQPKQFENGPDLEQKYHPSHMSAEEVQALIDRAYDNGKKDKEEEFMNLAFKYKLIGKNSIDQLDMDELSKRGIHWNDNLKVIILKDE